MPERRPRSWALPGAAVALAGCLVLEWRFARSGNVLGGRYDLLAPLALWWVSAAVGVGCLLRTPRRTALGLLAAGTVALHALALTTGPQLSDDLYRYAWDGRVQAAGIDPYRYPPADPALAGLRDPWLWPSDAECAGIGRAPGCTRLNRPGVPTIYPPVAERWFLLLHVLRPGGTRSGPLQAAAGLLSLALTGLLVAVLLALDRDPRLAALWGWSPLAAVETAMEGHVDVLGALLVVGGVWAVLRGRSVLAAVLITAAGLVKLYPAVVGPVALRTRRWPLALAAGAATAVVACLPHVLAVGPSLIGFLPGYLQEEEYADGSRFLLLGLAGLTGRPAQVAVVAVLLAVVALVLWRSPERLPPTRAALWLVGAALLLTTPVQPWYAVLLLALAALEGAWEWWAVAVAGYPVYFAAVLDGDPTRVGTTSYGVAAVVVLGAAVWRVRTGAVWPARTGASTRRG